ALRGSGARAGQWQVALRQFRLSGGRRSLDRAEGPQGGAREAVQLTPRRGRREIERWTPPACRSRTAGRCQAEAGIRKPENVQFNLTHIAYDWARGLGVFARGGARHWAGRFTMSNSVRPVYEQIGNNARGVSR